MTSITFAIAERVPLQKLIEIIWDIQAEWKPIAEECVLLQRPAESRGYWGLVVIQHVERDPSLTRRQIVYAIDALKRYYGV